MIYLDYNATTPLDPTVLESIHNALQNAWGNPSSSHHFGSEANGIIKRSRASIAKMINAHNSEIIFTSGGTESNNMVIHTAIEHYKKQRETTGKAILPPIPHIITSNQEHDSVCLPLKQLEAESKIELGVVHVSKSSGMVMPDAVMDAIRPNTCLVSLMLANNETGIIQPISEIFKSLQSIQKKRSEAGLPTILTHTDAAQALGKIPVDVLDLDVDYLTIVGHKFYGPRIGALYVRSLGEPSGRPLYPMFFGGGQERNYRPGTENTGMIAGLGQAAQLVVDHLYEYQEHMENVRDYLEASLTEKFGKECIHINGRFSTSKRLPNTCNVSFIGDGLHGRTILKTVNHLLASVGAACHSDRVAKPSHILLALGIPDKVAMNAVRMSVGRETSKQDIDVVVTDLKTAVESLQVQN
ncbi:predicted protein [Nematostella vectensis]|uniref:Selenocysteine lyase n=1 Tax=Nematostella vectensis TaxID=45351 RepID=A7T075_NEMVE|nr:predicted protein [Nematostella vectensis]|eukprot:XP_001622745.1 predicted protein [Nematostella vectensis]